MKKIILGICITIATLCPVTIEANNNISRNQIRPIDSLNAYGQTVSIYCVDGYKYLIVTTANGVQLIQMTQHGPWGLIPVKCEIALPD